MRKILLVILLLVLGLPANSYAGPQIFSGYYTSAEKQNFTLGFQYSWLKISNGNWQLISPGLATSTSSDTNWSLQLIGRRLIKSDRNKWTNPPDLYIGIHLLGKLKNADDKGMGISLSFGW